MADVFTEQDISALGGGAQGDFFTLDDIVSGAIGTAPAQAKVFLRIPESPQEAAQFAIDRANERKKKSGEFSPAEFRPEEQALVFERIGEIQPIDPVLRAAFGSTVDRDPRSAENILRKEFGNEAKIVRILDDDLKASNFYVIDKDGREFIWDHPDDPSGNVAEVAPDLAAGGVSSLASGLAAKAGPGASFAAGAVADALTGIAKQAFAELYGADEDLGLVDRAAAVGAEVAAGALFEGAGRAAGIGVDATRPTRILGRGIAKSRGPGGKTGRQLAIEAFSEGGGTLDATMAQHVRTAEAFNLEAKIKADPRAQSFFGDIETRQMQQFSDHLKSIYKSDVPMQQAATDAALTYRGLMSDANKQLSKAAKKAFGEAHRMAGGQAFIPTSPTVSKIDKLMEGFAGDVPTDNSNAIAKFLRQFKNNLTRKGRSASTSEQFQANLSSLKGIMSGRETIPGLKNKAEGQRIAGELLDSLLDSSRLARGQPGVPVAALDKLDEAAVGYRAAKEKIDSMRSSLLRATVKKAVKKNPDDIVQPLAAIKQMARDTTDASEVVAAIRTLDNAGAHLEASNLRNAVMEEIFKGVDSPAEVLKIFDSSKKSHRLEKLKAIMTPEQSGVLNRLVSDLRLISTKSPNANRPIGFGGELRKFLPAQALGQGSSLNRLLVAISGTNNLARIMTDPDKTKRFLGIINPRLPRFTGAAARFASHHLENEARMLLGSLGEGGHNGGMRNE